MVPFWNNFYTFAHGHWYSNIVNKYTRDQKYSWNLAAACCLLDKGNETTWIVNNNNKPNSKIIPSSPISRGMVVMTTSDYIQIITAGIYAAALFYTVITFRRSKKLDQITQTNVIMYSWRDLEIELDKVPPRFWLWHF